MGEATAQTSGADGSRRTFLKRVAALGAAASALSLLGRRGKLGSGDKSAPASLPGAGSIFQPRGDSRSGR